MSIQMWNSLWYKSGVEKTDSVQLNGVSKRDSSSQLGFLVMPTSPPSRMSTTSRKERRKERAKESPATTTTTTTTTTTPGATTTKEKGRKERTFKSQLCLFLRQFCLLEVLCPRGEELFLKRESLLLQAKRPLS